MLPALFSCYGEQSVNQSRAFIKNAPRTDALTGRPGSYAGSEKAAPDLQADMVGTQSCTQITGKGNNTVSPLSHPGEDDVSTEHR